MRHATLAYALQIYFDFAGYSDMAIGLARMLNIRFPLNFDSPYQAPDISAFWRRWHITLGAFLRDYVYIPMGGSRQGEWRRIRNLLLTMLLCGLWHGAAWRFVLWGVLHGVYLAVHTWFRRNGLRLPGPLAHGLTLFAVIVAWVPFRADNLTTAGSMLRAMAGANGIALPTMIVGLWPPLRWIATPVPVLPWLGDARTLSFPRGFRVSAGRLVHRPGGAQHARHVGARPKLGVDRRLRLHRAGAVLRTQSGTFSVFPVLNAARDRFAAT